MNKIIIDHQKAQYSFNPSQSPLYIEISEDGDYEFYLEGEMTVFEFCNTKNVQIKIFPKENAHLEYYSYSSILGDTNNHHEVILREINAVCNIYCLDVTYQNENHKNSYNMIHECIQTKGEMFLYGITKDASKCSYSGTNIIKKGMKQTYSNQKIRGIVLSDTSHFIAEPILLIDEFDCFAKHGATIGKISDEGLFYLMSRGLSKLDALSLIVQGFIDPLISKIPDEAFKDNILDCIHQKL